MTTIIESFVKWNSHTADRSTFAEKLLRGGSGLPAGGQGVGMLSHKIRGAFVSLLCVAALAGFSPVQIFARRLSESMRGTQ